MMLGLSRNRRAATSIDQAFTDEEVSGDKVMALARSQAWRGRKSATDFGGEWKAAAGVSSRRAVSAVC